MDTAKSGQPYQAAFSLSTDSGVLVPQSMRARVLDELDQVLVDWTAVPPVEQDAESATWTVPGLVNTLVPPQLRGMRVVQLEITEQSGAMTPFEVSYLVVASQLLVPGTNSFQTLNQAILEAYNYTDNTTPGWASTTDADERVRALAEAFERCRRMMLRIEFDNNQSIIRDVYNIPPRLQDLTPEQILRLDSRLLKALRQAQFLEADWILQNDEVNQIRAKGIQSMTTGESSQYFGAARPLDMGLCQAALKPLARWLRTGARIGRR